MPHNPGISHTWIHLLPPGYLGASRSSPVAIGEPPRGSLRAWISSELAAPSSFMQRALRKCLVLAGESPRTIRSHVKIFDQAIPD